MAKSPFLDPSEIPEEFPEEDFLRDGPMREEIIIMTLEALKREGHDDASKATITRDDTHREIVLDLLGDCRPISVIRALITDIRQGGPL